MADETGNTADGPFDGQITVHLHGSFGACAAEFGAQSHGHAQAVAETMRYLAGVVLPAAITQDVKLRMTTHWPRDTQFQGFGPLDRTAEGLQLQEEVASLQRSVVMQRTEIEEAQARQIRQREYAESLNVNIRQLEALVEKLVRRHKRLKGCKARHA